MNEFSFSNVLDVAWDYAKKHGLVLAVIVFIVGIVKFGLSRMFVPADAIQQYTYALQHDRMTPELMSQLLPSIYGANAIVSLLETFIICAIMAIIIGFVKGPYNKPDFEACRMPLMTYVKYFGAQLIVNILTIIGILCCILPGVFIHVRLQYAPVAIIDDPDCGIIEAISRSWNMTSGNTMTLIGLFIAYIVAAIVGLVCCCIGIAFSIAFIYIATVVSFYMLKGDYSTIAESSDYNRSER